MQDFSSAGAIVRFGPFELDGDAGELRKDGAKVRLQEQPLQVLQILLEQSGKVVSREELQKRIWLSDTFVDFDHGINNAIKRLREALGDTAETPRYIETLPRRGYRFIGQAHAVVQTPAGAGCGGIRSLAVLPLENLSGDSQQEYFADGMTEVLITNLAKISALQVVSRTTAMHYKGTRRPLPEIARELQVDGIVEGTVMRSGQRVRISAQLINARTDAHLWAESYDRDLRDVLELQSEVARAIAREVQVKVTPQEQTQLVRTRPVNPEAYEAYLKGRYYWNKRTGEAMKQGLECFRQAIEMDPTYAAAHAGLADSAAVLGWWGFAFPDEGLVRAKEAARMALSIDDTLPDPHACLGFSLLHYDYDFSAAEEEFRRALELNPRYATGVQWYSILLCVTGRLDECIAELHRATRLDPLSLVIQWTYAHFLFFARRYDETICEARKAIALDPNFGQARQVLGSACEEKGIHETALAELTEALRLSGRSPLNLGSLGHAYAGAGNRERALAIAKELQTLFPKPYPIAYWVAMIYANLNDKDEACRWLEIGYKERSAHMVNVKVDPRFDKLRSDSRFDDLLRRMNFPS